ncbi:TonB-dependent receptor [Flavisphingomonas formosensis]|uniref:TonB-dependent receptor n=1 Tax=Flavisphingomonas formosensis TaxID=861534 RepID=UPI0012FB3DCE|nr:TonB-dependent receptor [Sphingomonas formosensis]
MTQTKTIASALLYASASMLALGSSAAHAADSAPASTDTAAAADTTLTDIVVTGEKRETKLQSAPIAITAVAGDLMRQRNVNELNDLNGYVPGLNIAKSEGAERIITIRGIGYETAQNPNSQPGVAFHVDGVYIAHVIALNQDMLDVDRVEVLRGPQGTVFGETSTGGAINVITKKPVLGEASGTAQLSYGNYNYVKANGTVNIPISSTIAARASVQYLRHDGYGYSVGVPGRSKYQLDDANNIGVRGSLLWKPNDTFTALLEGQMFHADHNGALQKDIRDTTPGARAVDQDFPSVFKLNTKMIYLTLTQDIGDNMIAKSVSAYQYMNKHQTSDNDRLASPFYFDHITLWQDKSKTFTQEVSLASVGNTALEWTVGGFYLRQRALQNIFEVVTPFAAAVVLPDGTGVKFQTDSPFQHTSWAGYGQATYHATDALAFTLGARYSWDKVTAQPYQYFQVVPPRKTTSSAITGKVGVEYKVTPDNLLYVTASKGYKPTGLSFVSAEPFTPGSFSSGPQFVPSKFKKETVKALEIGSKNELFDKKFRFNASAYYYWYTNFQYTAEDPVPFAGGTDNIPKAEVYGAEFETSVLPLDGLRFDGTLSLGKGKFKSHYLVLDAQTAALVRAEKYAELGYPSGYYYDARIEAAVAAARQDVYGRRLPKMPGVQGLFSTTYTHDLGSGDLTIRGELVYRGKFNYRLFAVAALDKVPAYTIYNAFIEYAPHDKPWKVSFSAQNLTNKTGINSRFSDPYGSGTTSVEYINPRQVFGTVSFAF